ncbi:Fpg/Nei family DNA glycosylase [uncultured Nocardioides sp.]|uniref:Fpg/Nei family DNA glycosylase n=1 Tax=uncultured Nocardioides sp. TaxID=198441 RepID=UPI0025D13203|nr:DNA-formamidopyrimidine glycosylase family protein [uncultured Nocardioides sp.]
MPEGHTLRKLANDLTSAFAGSAVRTSSPQGRFAADAESIDGALVVGADSVGKHLFVEMSGERFVHVHLGLYGKLAIHTGVEEVPAPVGAVRLRLVTADAPPGGTAYADLRGATQCELVGPARRDEIVARLGPDPLRADADPARAWARISRSTRATGDLLMDQEVLAGVGNVYRAEVLFRHRIHPLRPGRTLRRGQFQGMWDDLVVLMADGVRSGRIDTVRPEHTAEATGRARPDRRRGEVYVYRRTGQPCLLCGTAVRTDVLVGRNLFWCPRCQPAFRSRAIGSAQAERGNT